MEKIYIHHEYENNDKNSHNKKNIFFSYCQRYS